MTAADFKAAMPAFASTADLTITRIIARSGPYFDATRWGDLLTDGLMFWVAHEIIVEQELGATPATAGNGLATVKKVGSEEIQFSDAAIAMQAKEPYMRTGYGQRYLELAKLAGMGAVAV